MTVKFIMDFFKDTNKFIFSFLTLGGYQYMVNRDIENKDYLLRKEQEEKIKQQGEIQLLKFKEEHLKYKEELSKWFWQK